MQKRLPYLSLKPISVDWFCIGKPPLAEHQLTTDEFKEFITQLKSHFLGTPAMRFDEERGFYLYSMEHKTNIINQSTMILISILLQHDKLVLVDDLTIISKGVGTNNGIQI